MKLLKRVTSIFDQGNNVLAFFASILIIVMMLIVVYEIFIRRFLNSPTIWTAEVTRYILLWITFLSAAWLLREEGHVKMDILLDRLNPRAQSILNIITSSICTIICLIITWYAGKVTWDQLQSGFLMPGLWSPPKWPIMAIIPVGFFLLFVQFMRRTYRFIMGSRSLSS